MILDIHSFMLFVLLSVLFIIYYQGKLLYFRNCEWQAIIEIQPGLDSLKEAINYITLKKTQNVVKHFFPLGLLTIFLKFYFFRRKFKLHYILGLIFHVLNTALIYFVSLKLFDNNLVAITSATLFGFNPIISDGIYNTLHYYLYGATLFLLSILFNPALTSEPNLFTNSIFYTTVFLSPFFIETGLFAPLVAICILAIDNQLSVINTIILTLPIALYFVGRKIVLGSIGNTANNPTLKEYLCKVQTFGFVIPSFTAFVRSIFWGIAKCILSSLGAICKIKVTDVLYVLKLDFLKPATFFSILVFIILFVNLYIHTEILINYSLIYIVLLAFLMLIFIMLSFGIEANNIIFDFPHIVPRNLYLPTALSSLLIGSLSYNLTFETGIFLIVYLVVFNSFFIMEQFKQLKPHTDRLRDCVKRFKEKGLIDSYYQRDKSSIDDYRLDWSFNEYSISAYYKIKMRGKIDFDPKTHNELGERLFNEGKIEEAKSAFVNAIVLNPKFAVPYNNLGVLFFQSGNYDLSYQYFLKGISLAPNNKELAVNFIHLLININSYDSAEAICRFSIHHNPDDKELLALLTVIISKRDSK